MWGGGGASLPFCPKFNFFLKNLKLQNLKISHKRVPPFPKPTPTIGSVPRKVTHRTVTAVFAAPRKTRGPGCAKTGWGWRMTRGGGGIWPRSDVYSRQEEGWCSTREAPPRPGQFLCDYDMLAPAKTHIKALVATINKV